MIILPIVTADANYQYLEALYGLNGKQGKEMAFRIIANCNQRSMDCRQRQSVVADGCEHCEHYCGRWINYPEYCQFYRSWRSGSCKSGCID
jgi:hypothetical protein